MIDQVRCITNIFQGRTGHTIAEHFASLGDDVHLLTSNISNFNYAFNTEGVRPYKFRTFDDLYLKMMKLVEAHDYDVIIHSAAVSDYKVDGTYIDQSQDGSTEFDLEEIKNSDKISSDHKELFLKLIPTVKIVDQIRGWGFKGKLVKFKLQVDMSDYDLICIAKASREHSDADIIVANCLEWSRDRAFIITEQVVEEVSREDLAKRLYEKCSSNDEEKRKDGR